VRKLPDQRLSRIIDANFNRVREGLRVLEDVCRFFKDERALTAGYKTVRHQLTNAFDAGHMLRLIQARDIQGDVGKSSTDSEFRRKDIADIFYANSQRVKESLRVLEELAKLVDLRASETFKRLRYRVYALEQKAAGRF
jgi:hypothetical protein